MSAMRYALALLFAVALFGPVPVQAQSLTWTALKAQIRAAYPEVRHLSTDSLATWLNETATPAPLLLDVRTTEEYAVSHLPGARRLDPEATVFPVLDGVPSDAPIVTYCSVGYRSAAMVQRLREAGYTNVVNLEGSIFEWANDGHPVYRKQHEVRQVHPYDALWGLLLDKRLRAYAPK